jgi:hypothetical protein
MTYALTHEKELLNRPHRCRMGVSQVPSSASQQARTTQNPQHPQDTRRGLLCAKERLSLATLAASFRLRRRFIAGSGSGE